MKMRALTSGFVVVLLAGIAHAAPVEVLEAVNVVPGQPDSIVLRYRNGGGGMFVSHDGGKSFALVCNSVVDASLQREATAATVRSDGTMLLGVFNGLWAGDQDACEWSTVDAFDGQWVNDFAADPLDATHTFAVTSAGGQKNGIYENSAGSDKWTALGTQEAVLINRLHVASLGKGRLRFYQSIVRGEIVVADADGGIAERLPNYVVRYSDDLGKTWTEHEFGKTDGTVRLLAVDPTNPDRVVLGVLRDEVSASAAPDELFWSGERGASGSFEKIGEVGELGGISFAPDGRLFYGDRHQSTPSLHMVAGLGDKPAQLSSDYKVSCLRYDAQSEKLYVCQDTLFGTADPKSGTFELLFDMTKADTFGSCGEAGSVQATCKTQLLAGYCGYTHYFCAPLCAEYAVQDIDGKTPAESLLCHPDGGTVIPGDAGGDPVTQDGGSHDASTDAHAGHDESDGGCSVAGRVGSSRGAGALTLFACLALAWNARRRGRTTGGRA